MNAPDRIFSTPQTSAQSALRSWQLRLADVRLPLLSPPQALQRMLGSRLSVRGLLDLIEADLALAVEVMLAASNTLRSSGKALRGLQHAVNLLGVERVQTLVRSRQTDPLDLARPGHQLALQAIANSRLACLFTNHWAARQAITDPDALIWTTALLGVVRWKLPLTAPDLAADIERRVAAGHRRATAERALLGVSLDELSVAQLHALHVSADENAPTHRSLPPKLLARAARLAWTGQIAPDMPPQLQRQLRQPEVTCSLAHGLATSLQDSWYSPHSRTLMAAASVHTHQTLHDLRTDLLQLALLASRESGFTCALVAPAARLLWERPRLRAAGAQARTGGTLPAASKPVPQRPTGATAVPALGGSTPTGTPAANDQRVAEQAVAAYAQRCRRGFHADLRTLMKDTVQTMEKQLGLRRCALFLKPAGSEQVHCHFAHGFGGALVSGSPALPAAQTNVLTRLLKTPAASLRIKPVQAPTARQQMPPPLAPLVLASGVALATVDIGQQPMGVWWADTGLAERALDDAEYAAFQCLVRMFGTTFTQLVKTPPARPVNSSHALVRTTPTRIPP